MNLLISNPGDARTLRLAGLDSTLTRRQLDKLAAHTDIIRVGPGETLCVAGRVARQFIAVADGVVELLDLAGHRRVTGPSTHIGGEELLHGRPHATTVVTRTECTLVVIFGPAFRSAIEPMPAPTRRRFGLRRAAHGSTLHTSHPHAAHPVM